MPGYNLKVHGDYARLESLQCSSCKLILRDAIQTEEGIRLCKSCCEDIKQSPGNICSKSGLKLEPSEPIHPDIAVRREVDKLPVKCANVDNGCPWTGKLKEHEEGHKQVCMFQREACPRGCGEKLPKDEIEEHLKMKCPLRAIKCQYCNIEVLAKDYDKHADTCTEAPFKCEHCKSEMSRAEMDKHLLQNCPVAVNCVGCDKTVMKKTISTHLKDSVTTFQHFQTLGLKVNSCKQKISTIEVQNDLTSEEISKGGEAISELQNTVKSIKERVRELEQQHIRENDKRIDDLLRQIGTLQKRQDEQQKIISNLQRGGVPSLGASYSSNQSSYDDFQSNDRLTQLETKLAEQERTSGMLKVTISELELQLQASLASTYNGSFLWRIPDVRRRRRDAIDGKITSIYSPPFYTGRNGYKMCIRAYLNGDGIGYNTHVSIFFVLMKGEYDPLLKWPFDYKVSLIMVDQDHKRHIVQTFKPSPTSSSFQRPKSDMNIASGCPKFAELKVLDNDSYVKDDVLYIKAIVDTTRIFHP